MTRALGTIALVTTVAASLGMADAAGAAELQPLQGYAIQLGERTATVYFRQEDGRKTLVTTVARPDFQGERSRRVTVLEPGATEVIPLTPSGILVLDASDRERSVAVAVRVDVAAGRWPLDIAEAE